MQFKESLCQLLRYTALYNSDNCCGTCCLFKVSLITVIFRFHATDVARSENSQRFLCPWQGNWIECHSELQLHLNSLSLTVLSCPLLVILPISSPIFPLTFCLSSVEALMFFYCCFCHRYSSAHKLEQLICLAFWYAYTCESGTVGWKLFSSENIIKYLKNYF